jgi:hypothetical protein
MATMRDVEIWIEALKTAKKGVGVLKSADGAFCCLGVACELNGMVGTYAPKSDHKCFWFGEKKRTADLPHELHGHFYGSLGQHKMKEMEGMEGMVCSLSTLNDHSETFNPVISALMREPENYVRLNGVSMFPDAEKRA